MVSYEVEGREPTQDDLKLISHSILKHLMALKKNPVGIFGDIEEVLNSVTAAWLAGDLVVLYHGDTLVGVIWSQVTEPWWTKKKALTEVLVLTVAEEWIGLGRIAAEYLTERAKAEGCAFIETAASMTDDPAPIKNLYMKRAGFTFSYPAFVKVIETPKSN